MNDNFLHQFHKAPRREFAASLYERISKPMKTTTRTRSLRTAALALSMILVLMAASFLFPTTRALADNIMRQFGVYIFVQATPEPKPIQSDTTGQQTADNPEKKDPSQDQASQLKNQAGANQGATASYAQDAAAASQLAGFSVLSPAYLPDGYQPEDISKVWTVIHEDSEVRASISYKGQEESSFLTIEEFQHQPGQSKLVESQEIVDVTVRGQSGVWVPDGHTKNLLVWEKNGITYLVISHDLSLDEVLKVAESLGQ